MSVEYLKKANPPVAAVDHATGDTVEAMLTAVRDEGREAVERYARDLDGWHGDIVCTEDDFARASRALSQGVRDDIDFAHTRVRDFAARQRESLQDFQTELMDGLVAGQRLIPVNTAGCYVPGGRYAHAASAIMSVCTAKVAGVPEIVACSPAHKQSGINPAILHAMRLSGASTVLALGGVQGVAAMAYGLYTDRPADIIVGPGNRFVAEAKRRLFGRIGIDVVAGPTESAIIADADADPEVIAIDLAGQAEHGPDSPVWLITTSREVGLEVIARVPGVIDALPEPARSAATAAWRDYAEVVWVETREEACKVSDEYAPEHLQVLAADLDWWLEHLTCYGSLFLGEETTVAYGDKCSGPNHILPTRGGARYSGGLSVGKFIKTVTYQRLSRSASREVGQVAARISRLEGMEGHARTADIRLRKYFPEQTFDPGILGGHAQGDISAPDAAGVAAPVSKAAPASLVDHSSDPLWFGKDMSETEAIPEAAIARAVEIMRGGRLHRYGEQGGAAPDPSLLEQEYADFMGRRYCVAVNSCGATMFLALKALGVGFGDKVLTSSFTLAPVPGAIAHAGAQPVLVETNDDYTTDLGDLRRKIESSGAKVFLLSHMRGHVADLEAICDLCDSYGVSVVEDCAHTMGASWDGRLTGTWGHIGCFSTQTYKHINSGEGGLLVTDDEDVAAQVILMSGSYMMYEQHLCRPAPEVFERWKYVTPNFSMRMSNLAAALLRPQIAMLASRGERWNQVYRMLESELLKVPGVRLPARTDREQYIASSIQFSVDLDRPGIERFLAACDKHGLYVKWFGGAEPVAFTSNYQHWHYIEDRPALGQSTKVMDQLLDLRTPVSLTEADCLLIGRIVEVAMKAAGSAPA